MAPQVRQTNSQIGLALLTCVIATILVRRNRRKRKSKAYWVKPWLDRRFGNLNIVNEFKQCSDIKSFKNFLRMNEATFNKLLHKIKHRITKKDTNMRECIPAKDKLIITLRYLATGESFTSLQYNYRVSLTTISNFIPLVCTAIFEELKAEYIKVPKTAAEWLEISRQFEDSWNFPNCLGALDGKHIAIKAQSEEGSTYYNYKGGHSIVLLALVDAQYNFLYINVGVNGRTSDSGILRDSDLSHAINKNALQFPEDRNLPSREKKVPFVIVADSAFPLSDHILKPYPLRNITKEQRIYNYRLSRARRVVENAFGILANRFRVLLNINALEPQKVKIITKTCCTLHNFLRNELQSVYTGVDLENEIDKQFTFLYGLSAQAGNRPKKIVLNNREEYKEYFNTAGAVSWQDEMI